MHTHEDSYVQVGQTCTRYWTLGKAGTNVVLIHGLGGFIENWFLNFEFLASSHQVYALDLLGHGRTDKPPSASYTVPDLAGFVRDFMTTLRIEQASLIGHSLGGAISLQCAINFPKMVEKLVLVDSAGLGKEESFFHFVGVPMLIDILRRRPSRKGLAQQLRSAVRDPSAVPDELVEISYQMAIQPGLQQALLKTSLSAGNLFGQRESLYGPIVRGLSGIKNKSLVIWGRQDPFLPVAHALVAASRLPNVRLEIFDSCGHCPMLERAQAFNQVLLEFLDD